MSSARALLHRWFVEYNPLYLASAALVLVGTLAYSRGLVAEGSTYGPLGAAAIVEVYGFALLLGAALLYRLGQSRSAVVLAVLGAVFQGDLTLHTETCVNLGALGVVASAAWYASYAGKIALLAWAMRLRLSRGMLATLLGAGAILVAGPYVLYATSPRVAATSALVAFYTIFALPRGVASRVPLSAWGEIVLGRAERTVLGVGAATLLFHFAFQLGPHTWLLWALAPLLLVARRARHEGRVWGTLGLTLLVAAIATPTMFAVTALLAGAVLAEHAARIAGPALRPEITPYRTVDREAPPAPTFPSTRAARDRLVVGAVVATYLAAWTAAWTGGPWPAHGVALDLAFGALLVLLGRRRVWPALGPLGWLLVARLGPHIPHPHSLAAWGGAAIALGFFLLLISLAVSWALRTDRS